MDDLKYYAGTSNILKYRNPPIPSRKLSSLTMSNIENISTLSPFTAHCLRSVEEIFEGCIWSSMSNFKIVSTTILYKGMKNIGNETCMMNVYENVYDLKYYVGTSYILESWNHPILSRHLSILNMSNFDAYMYSLKKFQRWPHSLLTVWGRCKMTFVMGVLEVPWNFKRVLTKIL